MNLCFVCGATEKSGELVCPSWIKGIISCLGPDFEIKILTMGQQKFSEKKTVLAFGRGITLFPPCRWNTSGAFAELSRAESIDAVIIFGTETTHVLNTMELCRCAGILDKTALFAQGIAYACARHYAEGVPEKIIRRYMFRDILRRENIRTEQKKMFKRAETEKQAVELAENFIGRTGFDKAALRMYNQSANYYKCNDILRPAFYDGRWSFDNCEKHRIFISQYYYPLKGFHYLLEAAAILKEKYPDLKIAAAGYNPIQKSVAENELKDSSYIRYIKSLVKRYNLQDNIELLGKIDEEQMKREYLKANVFVLPSTIENSPNSLGEAMMLGVPCVASDVGGVSDFVSHKEDAFVYPSSAPYMLAHYIDEIFSDRNTAERLGSNAKKRAEKDYDREQNIKSLEAVFKTISGNS